MATEPELIHQDTPPPLPKRTGLSEKKSLPSGCAAFIPSALFANVTAEASQSVHHDHVFRVSLGERNAENRDDATKSDSMTLDKENQPPSPPPMACQYFVCETCRWSLTLSTEMSAHSCDADGFLTHHYHAISQDLYQCCGCQYTIDFRACPPVVSNELWQALKGSRPETQTYADKAEGKPVVPTLESTLSTALLYVDDLLKGTRRNINTSNANFLARVGIDESSLALLHIIGFTVTDSVAVPPVDLDMIQLQQLRSEIAASLYRISRKLVSGLGTYLANAEIMTILGVSDCEYYRTVDVDHLTPFYATLGLTPSVNDELTTWVYRRLVEEDPIGTLIYFDAYVAIADVTQSEPLLTDVAIERSQGQSTSSDVEAAYQYFGVKSDDDIKDWMIIDVFHGKMTEDPMSETLHRQKLLLIAQARQSKDLFEFLDIDVNQYKLGDRNIGKRALDRPVGLDNIGNTCYLNSLLQYYFTLIPFRTTVIDMENYVENETAENWEPKRIGRIKVDKAEIRRAKKFDSLLRDLFVSMKSASRSSIAPEYDLAYMALLNQRDEDEEAKDDTVTAELNNNEEQMDTEPSPQEPLIPSETKDKEEYEYGEKEILSKEDEKSESDEAAIKEETSMTYERPPSYKDLFGSNSAPQSQEPLPVANLNKKSRADIMMFGRQQDVTECMGNMMYLVEASLKPLEIRNGEQVKDMIRDLFYGKARQILTYEDIETSKNVRKVKEEEFSHVIIYAADGMDLYDGLDEYFFGGMVEDFAGGRDTVREVAVGSFPPVLQILVQRVQYSRERCNVFKSNAFVQFDKTIYLDRYCDQHFDALANDRAQVATWRNELTKCAETIQRLTDTKTYPLSVPDMLDATANILEEHRIQEPTEQHKELYHQALAFLQKEVVAVRDTIRENEERVEVLKNNIKHQYSHLRENKYRLHAVFMHQGQANYGHYWIYIFDHMRNQWWKYNDSMVTKVEETEILKDTSGSTANPYFLVYVKASEIGTLVETVLGDDQTTQETSHPPEDVTFQSTMNIT